MSTTNGTAPGYSSNDRELLEEIRDNTRTMSVKLFGASDADKENERGRLPSVERSAKGAHERIDNVQSKIMWASGFAAGIGSIIGGALEYLFMRRG